WNAQGGSRSADVGRYHIERIALEVTSLGTQIRRLNGPLRAGQRNDVRAAIGLVQPFRVEKLGVCRRTGNCSEAERAPLKQSKAGEYRPANACRSIDDGFEYGFQLCLRRRNRREDIGRRSLLGQCLVSFGRAPSELALEISNDPQEIFYLVTGLFVHSLTGL